MDHRLKSYLRPHRRRWGFTQREVAFLIGVKSSTAVSRLESAKRVPSLQTAFACGLIFDAASLELFPDFLSEVQLGVLERTNELYEQLQGNTSKATRGKLDFLEALLARLDVGSTKEV